MGINPMALDGHDGQRVGLYDRQMALVDMIGRAVPTLSSRQRGTLSKAMGEAYARAGIDDHAGPARYRVAPTFTSVLAVLEEWASNQQQKSEWPRIHGCMAAIEAVFGHPLFQRQRNLTVNDLLQRNTRLDLSALSDSMQFLVAETVLRMVFNALRLQGPVPSHPADDSERFRLFIVVDEAKILSMGKDPNDPDCILNRLFTESRKFGIGLIVASQMREHFGPEPRANAAKRLVLKPMDLPEARRNATLVQTTPESLINLRGNGEGYLNGGGQGGAQRIQVLRLPVEEAEHRDNDD